jgi:hypothetical protein
VLVRAFRLSVLAEVVEVLVKLIQTQKGVDGRATLDALLQCLELQQDFSASIRALTRFHLWLSA